MAVAKHLCVVLQLVLIGSILDNQVSATIPNLYELRDLVQNYLIPHFQQGDLVLPGNQQFAVAILQPNTRWLLFRYNPSQDGNGQTPVINRNIPLSPPDQQTYNNYLAARPDRGVHSEIQILDRLGDLYNAYRASHNNQAPKALLLYSWIVPCKTCTDRIAVDFNRAPLSAIPTKVVAYTTNGGNSCSDCDVTYTENTLIRAGIDFTKVYSSEQLMELANTMAKLMQG